MRHVRKEAGKRHTVKFPAVVMKVASKAGGGLTSPHSRGEEAQMLASDRATHRNAAVAATAADKQKGGERASLTLWCFMFTHP